MDGFLGVPMKLMDETSRRLTVDQTLATFLVPFHRNTADLFEQIGLTLRHEQGLKLAKVAQFLGGSAPTDPALVTTQTVEKAFESEIIRGQTKHIITVQQLRAIVFPALG
jgi:hypothetical protein